MQSAKSNSLRMTHVDSAVETSGGNYKRDPKSGGYDSAAALTEMNPDLSPCTEGCY